MTRLRKSYAEVVREALASINPAHPEPVEGRAPNQREFGINDDYAWELFRPPPTMLPAFPRCWTPKVELDGER